MLLFAAFLFAELFLTVTGKTYNMLQLAWFTDAGEVVSSTDVFTSLIIVPIAVDHFNRRFSGVLPIFGSLSDCNVTLNLKIIDDQGLPSAAMKAFVDRYPDIQVIQGSILSSVSSVFQSTNLKLTYPETQVTEPMAVTVGALNVPIISHYATSPALSNKVSYPTFLRTIASDAQVAAAVAALFKTFKYTTVGLIYANDA